MISVEEALALVLDLVAPLGSESVPLRAALGRVMAAPAKARLTQPPFSGSAMDGYWLASADHLPNVTLTVVGESAAGRSFAGTLGAGQCIRIFTGAPVPAEGGIVVLQENVTRAGETITLGADLDPRDNIRPRGQDFAVGQEFHPARPLTAADLGLLAAMNIDRVEVRRRPEIAIISTGDELVMPGEAPGPDQIICSNNFIVGALAEAAGATVRMLPIAQDTRESLRTVFALAEGADLVLTSGGASVGEHDHVGEVAAELGLERSFWKLAMRPGKPLMAGRMGKAAMLGLPGNPVSATVCAHLFLLPMIHRMLGLDAGHQTRKAVLGCDTGPTGPRTHYMRARLTEGAALPVITPFDNQDSAMLSVLAEADALLIRPLGDGPRKAGDEVQFIPLR